MKWDVHQFRLNECVSHFKGRVSATTVVAQSRQVRLSGIVYLNALLQWYIDVSGMTSLVVYMYSIMPYYSVVKWETARWELNWIPPNPPPIDEDEQYAVETILDHRTVGR